jgi:hypothetical protein
MRAVWQCALSLVFGFIGGVIATNGKFILKGSEISAETIRATRFELVDLSDNPLAYWARDKQGQHVQIAFLDEKGRLRAEFGVEPSQLEGGRPIAYSPFTALIGSDAKVRIRQGLDRSQNPVLAMGDSKTENRLLLGHWETRDVVSANEPDPWDKWSLVFRDPSHGWRDYLDIGATTPLNGKQRTGYAVLRNSLDQQLSEMPR